MIPRQPMSKLVRADGLRDRVPSTFWVSLRYFNAYRIVIAALFVLSATALAEGLRFGTAYPDLFLGVSIVYLLLSIAFQFLLLRFKHHFDAQLIAQVVCDVIAVVLLTHASGGFRSGLETMLLVSLAGAALVGYGRMIVAFAALASIGVLLEQAVWVIRNEADSASFLQPGLISIGYFATAIIGNLLASRVIANETIARDRGEALARQVKVNELVIRDLQAGVLVVDAQWRVIQFNPQAAVLMGSQNLTGSFVGRYSTALAQALRNWHEDRQAEAISFSVEGRELHARFVDAEAGGGNTTVIYLEDESRIEERARQVKLAALGRLTANIAHEIRNPLSAIVHAGDLMEEENRAPARTRLTRIIRDNAARLDRMVKDVLELNRRDRLQRESLDLQQFLLHCVREIVDNEGMAPEGVRLNIETQATVQFDRVHLHQILWNLLRNAWRHSNQQVGSVELKLVRNADRLELHVIDDGEGVPADLRAQLFEPFFTTYSVGTGLGLYIARELCSANEASLDYVVSENGADFRMTWLGNFE